MQIYDKRKSFYQWDLNQKITSPDFVEGDEIHFCHPKSSVALVVEAYAIDNEIVADVPNILLQSSLPIRAFRYVTKGNSECTIDEKTFTVNKRPKPADYIYTETEVKSIKKLVDEAVKEAMENGEWGKDGLTPFIGDNGNWWIGEEDTGTKAEGKDGKTPQKGVDYWTETDKAEMKAYVDEAILGGEW